MSELGKDCPSFAGCDGGGVHRTFVGKVERGESATTVDSIAVLCSPLGVSLAEFFEPLGEELEIRPPRRQPSE